jgi:hypothetical protein
VATTIDFVMVLEVPSGAAIGVRVIHDAGAPSCSLAPTPPASASASCPNHSKLL